jgi:DNA-binding SARP family transcriptional activator
VLDFRILGPFEVLDGDRLVALGGPKQRALLVVLLLRRGEVVSRDRLIDELWGERPPATAAKTVQVYVSNLRKALGDGVLLTRGQGYLLQATPGQIDADRVAALVREGRAGFGDGDPQRASDRLREALALWPSPALADFAYEPFAQGEIARLGEERVAALEDRIDADLALGRHAALIGELELLVGEHPLRERLQALLMLALYRSGRQAEGAGALSAGAPQADRRARDRARAGTAGAGASDPHPGPRPGWPSPPSAVSGVVTSRWSAARACGCVAPRGGRGRDAKAARWHRWLGGIGERVLGFGSSDLAGERTRAGKLCGGGGSQQLGGQRRRGVGAECRRSDGHADRSFQPR